MRRFFAPLALGLGLCIQLQDMYGFQPSSNVMVLQEGPIKKSQLEGSMVGVNTGSKPTHLHATKRTSRTTKFDEQTDKEERTTIIPNQARFFSPSPTKTIPSNSGTSSVPVVRDRRSFLRTTTTTTAMMVPSTLLCWMANYDGTTKRANAVMENTQQVFEAGKSLTPDQARARFKEGQKSLDELIANYNEICDGGGDNVRRYLGTVGTTSGLYGVSKVMKILQEEADDIVEYTETMNEVNAALQGADGAAYMAIFVTTSSSSTPPQKYFDDAKIEVKRAQQSMKDLAAQLNIK